MSHHQIEISSIQQLWSSAKEQLNKLRESLYVSEQKNRELNETIHQEKTNYKEQEIKNEMVRQSQQTKFEEERREYETQLFNEQTKATHLQYEIDTLRSELQDKNITIDEYNTQKEISNSEYNKLENTMTTLQLESTVNNQSQVMQFDLEERLNQSLQHLQTQQTQLLESRAAHSDVLTKITNFENEVILLRSRETEIINQRDRALEDCQNQELRAKTAEEEAEKVIAWARGAETTASSACLQLNERMEEVQSEASVVLGLHNAAQTSLIEMREALSLCARREGQYRAKVQSYESEIAHLTHRTKMKDFEAMAAQAEIRGVSASALRAASHWKTDGGGGNSSSLIGNPARYDPTWMDPVSVRRGGSESKTRTARKRETSTRSSDNFLDETQQFISATHELLKTGEKDFGLSPTGNKSIGGNRMRPRVSWNERQSGIH